MLTTPISGRRYYYLTLSGEGGNEIEAERVIKSETMEAVGYTRISTKDQSTYSLDYQERAVREYCQKNGLALTDLFSDNGQSSYSFDRPEWKGLEKFLRKNKAVQYLVIFDYDRFSRNLGEALLKIKELEDRFGVKVVSTTDPFATDFGQSSNRLMRTIRLMFAEEALHSIRTKTAEGYYHACMKGHYPAKAPYGYRNTRVDGATTLSIDEDKAPIVRLIYREYLSGLPIEQVKAAVRAHGYTPPSGNSTLQNILTAPTYAGLIRVPPHGTDPERVVKGIHPPIVSEADYWNAYHKITGNKRIGVHSNEEVPLKGVLRCAQCGAMLSASNPKNKAGKTYWYYLCAKHRKNLSAKKLHAQLGELLDSLSFNPKAVIKMEKDISEKLTEFMRKRADCEADAIKALRAVERKIEAAEERYLLSEGSVNKKAFDKAMGSLRAQSAQLRERIADLGQSAGEYFKKLSEILIALRDVRGVYDRMGLYRQQQFLNQVFYNSLTHDGTTFRTPALHSVFGDNVLILKEKGLLVMEQPLAVSGETPGSTAYGSSLEQSAAELNGLHRLLMC